MTTSARVRKRQYEAAVKRENYLNKPDRPVKETVSKRPKTAVIYASSLIKGSNGTVSQKIEVQSSERSIAFFGGVTQLQTPLASTATDPLIRTPRFWTPAKVHAGVGLVTPTAKRSSWGTRVVKSKSASYSAVISSSNPNVTYDLQDARAKAIYTAISVNLGDLSYATFYLSPEMFNNHKA
jgi:hypothetical protein